MKFKDFIEITSTGDVAGFVRISLPMTRRQWPLQATTMGTDPEKKKKPKMQPQVQENVEADPMDIIMSELQFSYARSSGPGGQNVNKVNSKVILRWNVYQSKFWTDPDAFGRFINLFKNRINKNSELVISSEATRDQPSNKQDCLDKLREMIRQAMIVPVQRIPTRISPAKRGRLLDQKARNKQDNQRRRANKVIDHE